MGSDIVFESVGRALLHSVWITTLGGAIYLMARAVLHKSAALRHLVAWTLLLASALAPGALVVSRLSSMSHEPGGAVASPRIEMGSVAHEGVPQTGSTADSNQRLPWMAILDTSLPWVARVWALSVALLLIRLAGGLAEVRRWTRVGVGSPRGEWRDRMRDLGDFLQVDRAIELLSSVSVDVPCVVGVLKPVILVPAAMFARMPSEDLEVILLHELAHVRRRDPIFQIVQVLAETLLFFHPVARWLSAQVRWERELACDDLVVRATRAPRAYAEALVRLESVRGEAGPSTALALGAADGTLVRRIRRIAGREVVQDRLVPTGGLLPMLALAGLVLLGGLAWAVPSDDAPRSALGGPLSDPEGMVEERALPPRQLTIVAELYRVPADAALTLSEVEGSIEGRPWVALIPAEVDRYLSKAREDIGDQLELVSAPRLTTLDGQSASIKTGVSQAPDQIFALDLLPRIEREKEGLDLHLAWSHAIVDGGATTPFEGEISTWHVPARQQLVVLLPAELTGSPRVLGVLSVELSRDHVTEP